jgi:hypothetical protein
MKEHRKKEDLKIYDILFLPIKLTYRFGPTSNPFYQSHF